MSILFKKSTIALALSALTTGISYAGDTITFDNGVNLDWSLTTSYNVAMRVAKPDPLLTGEQNMWAVRNNDGNNNFDQWSLVNNRISAMLQTKISKGDSGFVLNASTFYDDVYHRGTDARPDKFKPLLNNGKVPTGTDIDVRNSNSAPVGEFSDAAKRLHGGYSRFLDVYGYTNLDIFGRRANIKLGRHVVSWGESLFFPNISMAQGPLDGSKANVPGTEIKEIMLPEDQISMSWQLSPKTTLLANYQFAWHPTIIDAPGSYLSRSDIVGPGGDCLTEWVPNQGCRVLPFNGRLPELNSAAGKPSANPMGGALRNDITPKQAGSAGIGLRQRISEETELGVYYLRYHERVPLPLITYKNVAGASGTPDYWQRYYQPNIHLVGASFSTSLGEMAVGGEISHRKGAPVLAGNDNAFAQFGTVKKPIYGPTTANLTQLNLNTFANFGRTFLAPRTLLLAELAWVNVSGVKAVELPFTSGTKPVVDQLSLYSKNNIGVQARFQLDYPGFAEGWDLSVPISYGQQLKGQNMMSNLGGKGDKILAVATEFTRGNLQLRADYVNWLGKPSTDDFGSRVLTDRDFVAVGVKYTF